MPGLLTKKEVAYLDKLIERNRKLGLKDRKEWSRPLRSPMTTGERQIRVRIRRKILAGVVDILKIRASGVGTVSEINNAMQLLCEKNLSSDERRVLDGILLA